MHQNNKLEWLPRARPSGSHSSHGQGEPEGATSLAGSHAHLPGGLCLFVLPCAAPPPGVALRMAGQAVRLLRLRAIAGQGLLCLASGVPEDLPPAALAELHLDDRRLGAFSLAAALPPAALAGWREGPRHGLLRLLLDASGLMPGLGGVPAFAALCHGLAATMTGTPRAVALSQPGAALSAWRVPEGPPPGSWFLLAPRAIHRLAPPRDGLLLAEVPVPPGALLLPPGGAALAVSAPAGLPSLLGLHRAAPAPLASALLGALAWAADRNPRCAALLREAQLLHPAAIRSLRDPVAPLGGALELALADGEGGVFLCGWLRDPLAMVAGLELRGPFGAAHPIPDAALHRVARPALEESFARAPLGGAGPLPGFLAHLQLPGAAHVAQWRLDLRLHSGEAVELVAPPGIMPPAAARALVLRALPPAALRPGLLEDCIAPAVARLHRAAMAAPGTPEVLRFGTPPRRPRCSLVIPLYRNLSFLRFQLAAFARDAAMRDCELVFVLDSPEQQAEASALLLGLQQLHDLPLVLLVQPRNLGFSAACNAGATVAAAPLLLFLNSDAVPAGPGWLAPLLRRLGRERRLAAVGPKLLFADGSLQHAGLLFRRAPDGAWLNDHYHKGLAADFPAACLPRRVPGLTGAALCVKRTAFEAAGGFCQDYVVGGYEDSDLCLKLRAAGGEIGYEPASVLFHYEQQSIRGHAGHAETLAVAYNRLLHHRRWDAAITALMRRFPDD